MKKIAIIAAASAAVLSVPALAAPGNQSTADGAATAEVVAPLTLTHDAGAMLNFGTFVPGTVGGSVSVTTAGVATAGGDVTLMPGSVEAADSFSVAGDAGRSFSIVTATGTVTSGSNSMAFTTTAPTSLSLNSGGAASFNVGGTLTVGANQPAGVYTGSYSVTVTYN